MTILSWSPEAVDRLKQHRQNGLSAAQCARALNEEFGTHFSRNAIIGKVYRLGLAKRKRNDAQPRDVRLRPRQPKRRSLNLTRFASVAAQENEPPAHAVTIFELRPHHCRWPFGDPRLPGFLFCGAQRADHLPYCIMHARFTYRPATQEERAA
jgi:GcrA cell cycle regulator